MTYAIPLWPDNCFFGLFLSHDIDQIHDRELFRILGDVNHIRRLWMLGERGSTKLALRRLLRAVFVPKRGEGDFRTILEIEAQYGFRSSFYVLHDPYWSRYGPRYTLRSKVLQRIVQMIREAGCEVGLHGGYYRFNKAEGYRESCDALRVALGIEVTGIVYSLRDPLEKYIYEPIVFVLKKIRLA